MESIKGWMLYGVIGAGVVGYNLLTEAERDDSGAIVDSGTVNAFEIRVGDCFNDADSSGSDLEEEISSIPAVPCAESHDNEVYAVFDTSVAEFPEGDGMYDLAFAGCLKRFEGFVGKDYETSTLDIYALYPTRESWAQMNDREIICAVYDMNANKLQGSARGSGL